MKNIKKLTYNNLVVVARWIMREKHYTEPEALKLARNAFDFADPVNGMDVWWHAKKLLTREEWEAEYGRA